MNVFAVKKIKPVVFQTSFQGNTEIFLNQPADMMMQKVSNFLERSEAVNKKKTDKVTYFKVRILEQLTTFP